MTYDLIGAQQVQDLLGCSRPTAIKMINEIEEMNPYLVTEVTGALHVSVSQLLTSYGRCAAPGNQIDAALMSMGRRLERIELMLDITHFDDE